MEKLASKIIDFRDDVDGTLFKEVFPDYNSIPEIIKTASREEPEDHEYALVMINNGQKFRKFAMHDAGNTALSVTYLLKTASQLPEDAVKIASDNLINASGRFRLPIPPELQELAEGMNRQGIEVRTREKFWRPNDSLLRVAELDAGRKVEKTAANLAIPAMAAGGAVFGAGAGAATAGEGNRLSGALKGGLAGGLVGTGVGYGTRHLAKAVPHLDPNLVANGALTGISAGGALAGYGASKLANADEPLTTTEKSAMLGHALAGGLAGGAAGYGTAEKGNKLKGMAAGGVGGALIGGAAGLAGVNPLVGAAGGLAAGHGIGRSINSSNPKQHAAPQHQLELMPQEQMAPIQSAGPEHFAEAYDSPEVQAAYAQHGAYDHPEVDKAVYNYIKKMQNPNYNPGAQEKVAANQKGWREAARYFASGAKNEAKRQAKNTATGAAIGTGGGIAGAAANGKDKLDGAYHGAIGGAAAGSVTANLFRPMHNNSLPTSKFMPVLYGLHAGAHAKPRTKTAYTIAGLSGINAATGAIGGAIGAGPDRRLRGAAAGGLTGGLGSAGLSTLGKGNDASFAASLIGSPIAGYYAGKTQRKGNVIDVSDKEAPTKEQVKEAKYTLLDGEYPVDTFDQIKLAQEYFLENWREFSPQERHEYCTKLAERMDSLKLTVPETVARYGSDTYAGDLDIHVNARKDYVSEELHPVLDNLLEKKAYVKPETFAEALGAFDQYANIDRHWDSKIADPYRSTFGPSSEKIAEENWNFTDMGLYINEADLKSLAYKRANIVRKQFGNDFATKFVGSPKRFFEKQNHETKIILARMASNDY